MAHEILTAQRAREVFNYDPLTGAFTWRIDFGGRGNTKFKAGSEAGTVRSDGRRMLSYGGRRYYAYRVAWLIVTGEWPVNLIDHKDLNPSNDAWLNLRDATKAINMQNQHEAIGARRGIGLLGAHFSRRRATFSKPWCSKIAVDGKAHYLGWFATEQEAHHAYVNAKRTLHKGCTL